MAMLRSWRYSQCKPAPATIAAEQDENVAKIRRAALWTLSSAALPACAVLPMDVEKVLAQVDFDHCNILQNVLRVK
jgi:hypothetical protein